MKALLLALFTVSSLAFAQDDFPTAPDEQLTPGTLCRKASELRYPEKIKYCQRDVSSSTKREVMKRYDKELGYQTTRMDRMQFKIDHYIPLCMGGGNDAANLWPQHQSVYKITDDLEFELCEKMKAGHLSQNKAIAYIKRAKFHLDEVSEILREVKGL